jgi:hypothetical protein
MHKEFFLTCNTLLHVSTPLDHLQGELFVVVTLRLHFIVELLTVYCVAFGGANSLWSRLALQCKPQQKVLPEDDPAGSKHVGVCYK